MVKIFTHNQIMVIIIVKILFFTRILCDEKEPRRFIEGHQTGRKNHFFVKKIYRYWNILTLVIYLTISASNFSYAGQPLMTDDAETQGKGKVQIEMGVSYWKNKEGSEGIRDIKQTGLEGTAITTFGLFDSIDAAISILYLLLKTETDSVKDRMSGVGDIGCDLKWRFFASDGWSLAIKPGLTFPTEKEQKGLGSGQTTYRVFFISSKELTPFSLHANLGYVRNENKREERRDIWYTSFAAEYEVNKGFKVMADTGISRNPSDKGKHPAFFLAGFAYSLTEAISVTGGMKWGLNAAEIDLAFLFGVVLKF